MHITKTSPPSMKPVITTGPKKGSAVRHSRPLHHRRTSSVQPFVALNTSKSYQSISKLLGAGGGSTVRTTNRIDDEDMATSFLQYCAMCETQIMIPDNSVLYCSERCREMDSSKPLSASYTSTSSMASSLSPPTSPPISPRSSTTTLSMSAARSSPRPIPGKHPRMSSDMDASMSGPRCRHGSSLSSHSSTEAWNYLSQFYYHQQPLSSAAGTADDGLVLVVPSLHRRSGGDPPPHRSYPSMPPSLTHTPATTAASSLSSNADLPPSGYLHDEHRPLPPRHNPWFSSTSGGTKGVQLVVPQLPTPPPSSTETSIHPKATTSSSSSSTTVTERPVASNDSPAVSSLSTVSTLVETNQQVCN